MQIDRILMVSYDIPYIRNVNRGSFAKPGGCEESILRKLNSIVVLVKKLHVLQLGQVPHHEGRIGAARVQP